MPRLLLLFVLRGHLTFALRSGGTFSVIGPAAVVTGLTNEEWICTHQGHQEVLEAQISPLAARELFGSPARHLTGRVTFLSELWGPLAVDLLDRMLETCSWSTRSRMLDDELARRARRDTRTDPEIEWAWRSIRQGAGVTTVSQLQEGSGWSRQRFGQRFTEQMGLPPASCRAWFDFVALRGSSIHCRCRRQR